MLGVKVGSSLRTLHTLYVKTGGTLRQLHSLPVKVGTTVRELLVQYASPWAGASVDAVRVGTGYVGASLTIGADGRMTSSTTFPAGNWITPATAGVGDAHRVRFDIVSAASGQSVFSVPSPGQWLSLSRSISLSNDGGGFYADTMQVRIRIQRIADAAITCDGIVTLSISREL